MRQQLKQQEFKHNLWVAERASATEGQQAADVAIARTLSQSGPPCKTRQEMCKSQPPYNVVAKPHATLEVKHAQPAVGMWFVTSHKA